MALNKSSAEVLVSEKFADVPVEEDTRMFFSGETSFEGYDMLYQMWGWDGYNAESIIFASQDVKTLSDDEVKNIVKRTSKYKDSAMTLSRTKDFVFCNFNFISD